MMRTWARGWGSVGLALVMALGASAGARAQNGTVSAPDVLTLPAPGANAEQGPDAVVPMGPRPVCGDQPITIARLAWPSAALLAEIHARVLEKAFGCSVQVLPGSMASATASMASTGQPAVIPELWVGRIPDVWNHAVNEQKLRQVSLTYPQRTFEGWFIPDYVAAANPGLKSVGDLKANWKIFANGGAKGELVSCPAGWGCAVINANLLKANGLDQVFKVVTPANRYALDQTIAAAVSAKRPILFYYWRPNAALAQFKFVPLDLGPYNKADFSCLGNRNCPDPKPSGFAPEDVVIALANWVFTDAPEVASYFQRASMPMSEMNTLLAQLNAPGGTIAGVADKFVAEREDIWQQWVGKRSP